VRGDGDCNTPGGDIAADVELVAAEPAAVEDIAAEPVAAAAEPAADQVELGPGLVTATRWCGWEWERGLPPERPPEAVAAAGEACLAVAAAEEVVAVRIQRQRTARQVHPYDPW
jgi:hypothetical protein